jgi:hypothetical protein
LSAVKAFISQAKMFKVEPDSYGVGDFPSNFPSNSLMMQLFA